MITTEPNLCQHADKFLRSNIKFAIAEATVISENNFDRKSRSPDPGA